MINATTATDREAVCEYLSMSWQQGSIKMVRRISLTSSVFRRFICAAAVLVIGTIAYCKTIAQSSTTNLFESLAQSAARRAPSYIANTIVVVEVNKGFLPMARNFMYHAARVYPRLDNTLYVALDSESYDELQKIPNILVYADNSGFPADPMSFRTPGYNKIVKHK